MMMHNYLLDQPIKLKDLPERHIKLYSILDIICLGMFAFNTVTLPLIPLGLLFLVLSLATIGKMAIRFIKLRKLYKQLDELLRIKTIFETPVMTVVNENLVIFTWVSGDVPEEIFEKKNP